MTKYKEASRDVITTAQDLIAVYHPQLADANISFIFRDEPAISKGMEVWGKVKTVPAWLRAFPDFEDLHFVIEIAESIWATLDSNQRKALIDHELCHCKYDSDKEKASMRAHDFEEFTEIVERRGFWNPKLFMARDKFAQAVQDELPGLEVKPKGNVSALSPEAVTRTQKLIDEGAAVSVSKPEKVEVEG